MMFLSTVARMWLQMGEQLLQVEILQEDNTAPSSN